MIACLCSAMQVVSGLPQDMWHHGHHYLGQAGHLGLGQEGTEGAAVIMNGMVIRT